MGKSLSEYHFTYQTPEEIKRAYHEIFYSVWFEGPVGINKSVYRMIHDLDKTRGERRMRTALKYLPVFRDELIKEADIEDPSFHIEEEWAVYNAFGSFVYDPMESSQNLLTGIAIWFLDQITSRSESMIAFNQLSSEMDLYEVQDVYIPGEPMAYEYDTVACVMYIIAHRNDDCKGYRRKMPKGYENSPRVFIDDITAKDAQHQDCLSRNRFERLVNMIPEETRNHVRELFRKKAYELMLAYFHCRKATWKASAASEARFHRYEKKLLDAHEVMMKNRNAMRQGKAALSFPLDNGSPLNNDELGLLSESVDQCIADMDETDTFTYHYRTYFSQISVFGKEAVEKNFGPGVWELWKDRKVRIENPYEVLAGMLFLLDEGDDLIWLYGVSGRLVSYCAEQLPWNGMGYDEAYDPIYGTGETDPDEQLSDRKEMDWFALNYSADPQEREGMKFSLAQILHEFTNAIIPSRMNEFLPVASQIQDYGFQGRELDLLLGLCSVLAQSQARYGSAIMEPVPSSAQEEETSEDTVKEVRSLRKKNETLEDEVHRLGRQLRRLKQENENQKQIIEDNKKELGGLREAVFNLNQEEEQAEPQLDLPYTVQKKTVVYGGHSSWRNAMKENLKGEIRFADPFEKPNLNRLRNADVIWLQTNAISHSSYYAIINEVRKDDLELHYFSYAGPKKCIRQLMESEKE
jgi:hypothetical protein